MNSSGKTLTVLIGGVVVVTLLAFLALSGVAATFAWMAGGGYGSGPALCQAVTPGTDPPNLPLHLRLVETPLLAYQRARSARGSWPGRRRWQGAVREIQPVEGVSAIRIATSPGTKHLAPLSTVASTFPQGDVTCTRMG